MNNLFDKIFGKKGKLEQPYIKVNLTVKPEPEPEPSCVVKTILKDLENLENFEVIENVHKNQFSPNVTGLTHKTKGYQLRYWHNAYFRYKGHDWENRKYHLSLGDIHNYEIFKNFEEDLISKKLEEIENEKDRVKKIQEDREDREKLKQWFPECFYEDKSLNVVE